MLCLVSPRTISVHQWGETPVSRCGEKPHA
jgi:hypothetical protein